MAQMHLEQFTEAAKTARALSEVEPPEVATMREMDALMAQQEFPAAIELYTTKISQVPALQNQPHAICLYAAALFRSLETEAAIEQLDNAKRRFPNHPLVLLKKRMCGEICTNLTEPRLRLNPLPSMRQASMHFTQSNS